MVLHNPNNWHWVNKDVSAWAKQWFEDNVLNLEVQDGDVAAKISKIQSMDGDVDVSQRKGKVITIFDVKLVLEYTGSTADETDVSGTITVPEVAHDTEEDEFVVCNEFIESSILLPDERKLTHLYSLILISTPSPRRSSLSKILSDRSLCHCCARNS